MYYGICASSEWMMLVMDFPLKLMGGRRGGGGRRNPKKTKNN